MTTIASSAVVDGVRVVGPVEIGADCIVESGAILGVPAEIGRAPTRLTRIERGTHIRSHSIIYEGVTVAAHCRIAHHVIVRDGSSIGEATYIMPMTEVHQDVMIGTECRVRGFACSRSVIGNRSSMLGSLIHEYQARRGGSIEPSPVVGSDVVVGMEACVIGAVTVGDGAFIAAGAIVTRDVEPSAVVAGVPARLLHLIPSHAADELPIFPLQSPKE